MAPLPSIVFLQKHFTNGGVNREGYESLRSVIGMIGEMGWETHIIYEGEIAFGVSMRLLEGSITRILRVCKVFKKNMRNGLVIAESAANVLPDLEDAEDDELDDLLATWRNKLSVLHVPDGNDKVLFYLIFLHYDDTVHRRLAQLHEHRPDCGLGSIFMRSTEVYFALKELYQIPEAADELVTDLRTTFKQASEGLIVTNSSTSKEGEQAAAESGEHSSHAINKPLPKIPRKPLPTASRTPLKRRPTFVSRDTEVQDRVIKGQIISSRRPSTKGKASIFDESTDGMEAWWRQKGPEPSPSPKGPTAGANRKKTI